MLNCTDEILSSIEHVDYVGSAVEIASLVPRELHGKFEYIVSSHNFEHLPNPIKFLNGCSKLLKPGGVLAMAIPDARACFDFFRPNTILSEWLQAFDVDQKRPNPYQAFQFQAYYSLLSKKDDLLHAFSLDDNPSRIKIAGDLFKAYSFLQQTGESETFTDTHCSVMTPTSFELLIEECRYLKLTSFQCANVSETVGCEFHVRLINMPGDLPSGDFNHTRTRLAFKAWEERAQVMRSTEEPVLAVQEPAPPLKKLSLRKNISLSLVRPIRQAVRHFRRTQ